MSGNVAQQHKKPTICRTSNRVSLPFSWHETQSCMDVRQPDALNLEYTRTMMGFLLFAPDPENLAMVGLGGGSLAKFCHRHLPKTRIKIIKIIEINPHVLALRDVLLVDGYDHQGLPMALSSQRFYDDCFEMLGPDGMLVANLHCDHERWHQQVERIRRSFGGAILIVDDDEGSNSIVFASKAWAQRRSTFARVLAAADEELP